MGAQRRGRFLGEREGVGKMDTSINVSEPRGDWSRLMVFAPDLA
jgi:hypothetical protein